VYVFKAKKTYFLIRIKGTEQTFETLQETGKTKRQRRKHIEYFLFFYSVIFIHKLDIMIS